MFGTGIFSRSDLTPLPPSPEGEGEKTNMLHAGAQNILFNRARALRKKMTPAEEILWRRIKDKKFLNLKFRRQHPYGHFIFDFFCFEQKIAIEVDGEIHESAEHQQRDAWRTEIVAESGVKVFRVRNKDVTKNLAAVLKEIATVLSPLL
jgi:very-short-patch-repair endonuclease